MFPQSDPTCPQCGSKIRDAVSEFLFSGAANPTGDKDITARVRAYKCVCGHRFILVDYEPAKEGAAPERLPA